MTSSSEPVPAAPEPGDRLGRYLVDQLLGQGGFAWVYAATRDDGKSFAIKVLKPRYATDKAFESRFRQEAALLGMLQHPAIAQVYDAGKDPPGASGTPYLALELIEVQGLSYAEASTRMRVGLSNMKMILFRARQRIRAAISSTLRAGSAASAVRTGACATFFAFSTYCA